jgi:hypothetical protein
VDQHTPVPDEDPGAIEVTVGLPVEVLISRLAKLPPGVLFDHADGDTDIDLTFTHPARSGPGGRASPGSEGP